MLIQSNRSIGHQQPPNIFSGLGPGQSVAFTAVQSNVGPVLVPGPGPGGADADTGVVYNEIRSLREQFEQFAKYMKEHEMRHNGPVAGWGSDEIEVKEELPAQSALVWPLDEGPVEEMHTPNTELRGNSTYCMLQEDELSMSQRFESFVQPITLEGLFAPEKDDRQLQPVTQSKHHLLAPGFGSAPRSAPSSARPHLDPLPNQEALANHALRSPPKSTSHVSAMRQYTPLRPLSAPLMDKTQRSTGGFSGSGTSANGDPAVSTPALRQSQSFRATPRSNAGSITSQKAPLKLQPLGSRGVTPRSMAGSVQSDQASALAGVTPRSVMASPSPAASASQVSATAEANRVTPRSQAGSFRGSRKGSLTPLDPASAKSVGATPPPPGSVKSAPLSANTKYTYPKLSAAGSQALTDEEDVARQDIMRQQKKEAVLMQEQSEDELDQLQERRMQMMLAGEPSSPAAGQSPLDDSQLEAPLRDAEDNASRPKSPHMGPLSLTPEARKAQRARLDSRRSQRSQLKSAGSCPESRRSELDTPDSRLMDNSARPESRCSERSQLPGRDSVALNESSRPESRRSEGSRTPDSRLSDVSAHPESRRSEQSKISSASSHPKSRQSELDTPDSQLMDNSARPESHRSERSQLQSRDSVALNESSQPGSRRSERSESRTLGSRRLSLTGSERPATSQSFLDTSVDPPIGQLEITSIQGQDLPKVSSPVQVRLSLLSRSGAVMETTSTKGVEPSANPVWDQGYIFQVFSDGTRVKLEVCTKNEVLGTYEWTTPSDGFGGLKMELNADLRSPTNGSAAGGLAMQYQYTELQRVAAPSGAEVAMLQSSVCDGSKARDDSLRPTSSTDRASAAQSRWQPTSMEPKMDTTATSQGTSPSVQPHLEGVSAVLSASSSIHSGSREYVPEESGLKERVREERSAQMAAESNMEASVQEDLTETAEVTTPIEQSSLSPSNFRSFVAPEQPMPNERYDRSEEAMGSPSPEPTDSNSATVDELLTSRESIPGSSRPSSRTGSGRRRRGSDVVAVERSLPGKSEWQEIPPEEASP